MASGKPMDRDFGDEWPPLADDLVIRMIARHYMNGDDQPPYPKTVVVIECVFRDGMESLFPVELRHESLNYRLYMDWNGPNKCTYSMLDTDINRDVIDKLGEECFEILNEKHRNKDHFQSAFNVFLNHAMLVVVDYGGDTKPAREIACK